MLATKIILAFTRTVYPIQARQITIFLMAPMTTSFLTVDPVSVLAPVAASELKAGGWAQQASLAVGVWQEAAVAVNLYMALEHSQYSLPALAVEQVPVDLILLPHQPLPEAVKPSVAMEVMVEMVLLVQILMTCHPCRQIHPLQIIMHRLCLMW